jgi:hypothetical protein
MKKTGFTVMELIISLGIFVILSGSIIFVYMTCFRTWDASQNRMSIKSEMTQAVDNMVRNLRKATSIDALTDYSVSFTADLGEGSAQYKYYLYNPTDAGPYPPYNATSYYLLRASAADALGQSPIAITYVKPPGTAVFSQSGNLITIDLTSVYYGETLHMRTKVRPRNL